MTDGRRRDEFRYHIMSYLKTTETQESKYPVSVICRKEFRGSITRYRRLLEQRQKSTFLIMKLLSSLVKTTERCHQIHAREISSDSLGCFVLLPCFRAIEVVGLVCSPHCIEREKKQEAADIGDALAP